MSEQATPATINREDPRWKGIRRDYSTADVEKLQGSVQVEHTLARLGAEKLWRLLEEQHYVQAQQEMIRVILPFMQLWAEMEQYTNGDGYLDKLCMELVGLDSSRCRPPTRDVRDRFREQARQMLLKCETPGVLPGVGETK